MLGLLRSGTLLAVLSDFALIESKEMGNAIQKLRRRLGGREPIVAVTMFWATTQSRKDKKTVQLVRRWSTAVMFSAQHR